MATACNTGYNGVYEGDYHYTNNYGVVYGMKVKVTVENNIITKVEDVTDGAYVTVSEGWVDYYITEWNKGNKLGNVEPIVGDWGVENAKDIEPLAPDYYMWTNDSAAYWTNNENWLLQQYEGKSVSEVLDVKVFVNNGEPYKVTDDNNQARNPQLSASGLLISGATQGSGRLLLAVQNALSK